MKPNAHRFLVELLSSMYDQLVIDVYEDRIREAAQFLNNQWDSDICLMFDRDFHWRFGLPDLSSFTNGPNIVIKVQHYIAEYEN